MRGLKYAMVVLACVLLVAALAMPRGDRPQQG